MSSTPQDPNDPQMPSLQGPKTIPLRRVPREQQKAATPTQAQSTASTSPTTSGIPTVTPLSASIPATETIPPATPAPEPAHNFQRPADWGAPTMPIIEDTEEREPVMPDKPSPSMPKVTETEAQTEVISTNAVKAAATEATAVSMPNVTPATATAAATNTQTAMPQTATVGVGQQQQVQMQPPSKPTLVEMFMPEPSKAPPLEWAALGVGAVLVITAFLPWFSDGTNSVLGISINTGTGWIAMGAGLLSLAMGFLGLSRDSISLAAGQALMGLVTLIFCAVDISGASETDQASFGIYAAIAVSVVLIGISLYNAYDAFKKGAKY